MKKTLIALLLTLIFTGTLFADSITLNSSEDLSVPSSQKIGGWYIDLISQSSKTLVVKYYWEDSSGKPIILDGKRNAWLTWECRNIEVPGTNAECTDIGVPYECCTGAGTGTCDDMIDTCFTDVFGFEIRAQDVGTTIGIGLRDLLWNKMKVDILSGGNDGSFD